MGTMVAMGTTLITGGHAGLGLAAATHLAARGENLVLAGRDLARVSQSASELSMRFGVQVETLLLDLASLASIRSGVKEVRRMIAEKRIPPLGALLCNAGAQFRGPISYSKDGFEETFAVNYLGHFLLVNLLLDTMTKDGRIVFTASGTHDPETMDGKSVGRAAVADALSLAQEGKSERKSISGGKRYATSKLCTMLFSYELSRRLEQSHSTLASIAFDPGFIPETGLGRTAPPIAIWLMRTKGLKWFLKRIGITMGSLSFSGEALARIAISPEFGSATGQYLQSINGALLRVRSSDASHDEGKAAKLWTDSEVLVSLQKEEKPEVLR